MVLTRNDVGRIVYWLISLLSLQLACGCQNGPPAVNASLKDPLAIRVLRLLPNKAKQTLAAIDFIKFVQSSEGQDIVDDLGYVRRLEPRQDSYSQN